MCCLAVWHSNRSTSDRSRLSSNLKVGISKRLPSSSWTLSDYLDDSEKTFGTLGLVSSTARKRSQVFWMSKRNRQEIPKLKSKTQKD